MKIILFFVMLIVSFVMLYFIGQRNKQNLREIEINGIESIGTVINRTQGIGNGGITVFGVWYDFFADGELIRADQLLKGEREYNNAILGMKYKVKYLPYKPNANSIIFINEPIMSEYKNIPEERERIMYIYENAKVFLKKNAQPLDEIKHLIEK